MFFKKLVKTPGLSFKIAKKLTSPIPKKLFFGRKKLIKFYTTLYLIVKFLLESILAKCIKLYILLKIIKVRNYYTMLLYLGSFH